jgi:2-polyprenyl-3-methyl-5-hydroxy-6-metoxy-1,4-benzoquinol methylase
MPKYNFNNRPEILKELDLENLPNRVLDVGCGTGLFAKQFKDLGVETWGIEPFDNFAHEAEANLSKIINKQVEVAIQDLPDACFDMIFFNDVIEHLIEPESVIKSILPKLTENGLLISSIPNVRWGGNLKELILKGDWEYKEQGILDHTHLRFFTQKSILRMWKNLDLEVVSFKGINGYDSKSKLMKINNLLIKPLFKDRFSDVFYLQFLSICKIKK